MKKLITAFFIATSFFLIQTPSHAYQCPGDPRCIEEGGGGSTIDIGTIQNSNLPSIPPGGENSFVAGIVRNGISLLLIVAFIIDLIWTILAGFQFIFAGGDPKNISTAWSRIYWGLIGMAIVMSSFAIIKLVELFFGVNLISGGLSLPRI